VNRDGFSLHALHILGVKKIAQMALIRCASRSTALNIAARALRRTAHSAIVDIRDAGTDVAFRASDFIIVWVRRLAAKPAPNAKRITGPKLFAAAIPTK
jgi:hypothetical protein